MQAAKRSTNSCAPASWRRPSFIARLVGGIPLLPLALWGCLWLNLDTGFWDFEQPDTFRKMMLAVRAALIFPVLLIAFLVVVQNHERLRLPRVSPSRLLVVYGAVCAVATFFSPHPWRSFYWAVAYLAILASPWTWVCQGNTIESSRRMLQVTWVVTLLVAAIIAYTTRNVVFGSAASAYGIAANLEDASRSSGVARWAAVPGLVCLLKASHTRRPLLLAIYLSLAGVAFFIVYRMQSRGAVFASVVALAFGLLAANRLRRYFLPAVIFGAALLIVTDPGFTFAKKVYDYVRRGQSEQEFRSMTGRTRAYKHAIQAFQDAPLLGRGHWADRMIIGEHAHNSFLQALLSAGIIGFIPYLGSWVAGWLLFVRLLKMKDTLPPADRAALMEAGTVMLFFTVRAMPETTTASYAVDLLVMAAIYVYLEALTVAYPVSVDHWQRNRVQWRRRAADWSRPRVQTCP